jgi:hypothetical protein
MTAPLSPRAEAAIHALHPTIGGSAGLLTIGVPCRAVLLAVLPLDAKTPAGEDATGLILSVTIVGLPPQQVQVGVYVPPEAHHLLVAGRDLPGRATPDAVESISIDWPAALAEAQGGRPEHPAASGFHIADDRQDAPSDPAPLPEAATDPPTPGAVTGEAPRPAGAAPLKPGDKRGAVAPATIDGEVAGARLSNDDLIEISALILEMNEVHLRALTALHEHPDESAELSAQWQPLIARAFELVPLVDGVAS